MTVVWQEKIVVEKAIRISRQKLVFEHTVQSTRG